MAKKREVITINGERFVIENRKVQKEYLFYKVKHLHECYEKPSKTKIEIYNYWHDYFSKLDAEKFSVGGYNGWTFTINFILNYNNKKYLVHISKTSHKLYEVEE